MKFLSLLVCISISIVSLANSAFGQDEEGIYRIGTGIGDVTGPAAGVQISGTIKQNLLAAGIHTRLYARSFIVQSLSNDKKVVFVSCDLGMFDHGLKLEVIKKLKGIYGNTTYTEKNVQISATHTNSGPSGYMQYYAYIAKYGFNPLTFRAIVDGIVESIQMAHTAMTRGQIYLNKGDLIGYNENSEPKSYEMNPEEEKAMYNNSNVDTKMISLKLVALKDNGMEEPIGSFNWWPVDPISFNAWDNPLISSDSRGYASVTFDYQMNKEERPRGEKFVSAFVASNLGDVSPKIPGRLNVKDKLEKVAILGQAQFEKAYKLFNGSEGNPILVKGPIGFVQRYVNLKNKMVSIDNPEDPEGPGIIMLLCKAALGYSFFGLDPKADPGKLPIQWKALFSSGVFNASMPLQKCQKPKSVAMAFEKTILPWKWMPSIVDLNILRIGSIDIVSMPGKFTTMAGRRLKKKIRDLVPNQEIIISGLANNYINSVATPEEYSIEPQGSAGGATLFGKYTLNAIIDSHKYLVTALDKNNTVNPGIRPLNLKDFFKTERNIKDRVDRLPKGKTWGDVLIQPPKVVHPGEKLHVQFLTPSLRHNPLRNKSHFLIQIQKNEMDWTDVRTDADLDTTFYWNRVTNAGNIYWYNIPNDVEYGTYRMRHFGYFLENEKEAAKPFNATSSTFQIAEMPSSTTAASTQPPTTGIARTTTQTSSAHITNIFSAFVILFAVLINGFGIF